MQGISIKKGAIFIQPKQPMRIDEVENIRTELFGVFGDKVKIFVVDPRIEITVISEEE